MEIRPPTTADLPLDEFDGRPNSLKRLSNNSKVYSQSLLRSTTHPPSSSDTMASTTVNVVRYTALLSGVFYGISHRRTLQKAHDEDKRHHAIHEREHLIEQAKEAWKKKQETSKDSIVTNPEDPHFDLEKLIAKWEKESS
ncbi:hypothetical protein QCA50_010233 [Cerrena zonata]|uniref:ATP synthase F(0) complex subunit e, mitochondrial n=1 Tax=Cerrena zonata TaxID=2478898 RepID=A0AAW0FYN7_9APHY